MSDAEPKKRHTPSSWRRIAIDEDGNKFRLAALISHIPLSATDLKFYGLDTALKVSGLTLNQALTTGEIVDAAAQAFHASKAGKK